MSIEQSHFIDLYLGATYCDVRGLQGAPSPIVAAPESWATEIDDLRTRCKQAVTEHGEPEFALLHGKTLFRVTHVTDIEQHDVFCLRRTAAHIRPLDSLALPAPVVQTWREPNLSGLVLVTGKMGAGKTSTAAGFVVDRLNLFGGLAFAVEDPPETHLEGATEKGRCIQVPATRKSGGFKENLIRGMRMSADLMFIGEIRDSETAAQVLTASINGHLILATMHAGSVPEATGRLASLARPLMDNSTELLASGLRMVINQHIERRPAREGMAPVQRMTAKHLILPPTEGGSIRTKIKLGKHDELSQDVEAQSRAGRWRTQ